MQWALCDYQPLHGFEEKEGERLKISKSEEIKRLLSFLKKGENNDFSNLRRHSPSPHEIILVNNRKVGIIFPTNSAKW